MYDKIKTLVVMLFVGGLLGTNVFSDAALAPPLPIPAPKPAQIPSSLPDIVNSQDTNPVSATKNSSGQVSNVRLPI